MQRKAVMATEGALLILAGAGSGKTTVLINRIANLMRYGKAADSEEIPENASIEDIDKMARLDDEARRTAAFEPVEPWRILAITFTNKAADELKTRLSRMLGEAGADVWASTFHSACVRILRRDADRLGFTSNFTIYDSSDSQSLIKHILRDFDLDDKKYPPRMLLSEISRAKDDCCSPEQYYARAKATGDARRVKIAEIYAEYARRAFAAGAMDFDDLIYYTVKLLDENEDVRQYWQRRFKYILIDEYQDTNKLQYMLASKLAEGWGNICVVGDDDQSIYKFRGATIENILSFEDEYKGCRVIRLEQNYRSTGHILAAANAVIANNAARKGKKLWTDKGDGERITLYVAKNEDDEAEYVVRQVLADLELGENLRDHAVLYRTNAQSRVLEQAFLRNGIRPRIVKGNAFFERAEIKDMMAYFFVLLNPADDLRLTRIINNPPRGIGATTIERVAAAAAGKGCGMYEIMKNAAQYPELGRAAEKLRGFTDMMDGLMQTAENGGLEALYDAVLEQTGYARMLEAKHTDDDLNRLENVKELKSFLISHVKQSGDDTLAGFLDEVSLYTDLQNTSEDENTVTLMTIHSAKGLEYPCVFLVGAEEGLFPSLPAIGEAGQMEEERRLAYVAITRARRRLYITCARQRMIYGQTASHRVSRFVDEIPPEDLDRPYTSLGGDSYFDFADVEVQEKPRKMTFYGRPVTAEPAIRPPKKQPAARPSFRLGDRVRHRAFKDGTIVKLTPMGGDHLVEIEFDDVGLKRLMLKAAAQHMEKI